MAAVQDTTKTNTALMALWALAAYPVLTWVYATVTHEQHRMNAMLMILLGIVLVHHAVRRQSAIVFTKAPVWRFLPALVASLGFAVFLYAENHLDIDLVSAAGFAIGSIGILGFYNSGRAWLRLFPATLLLIAVLPFQFHLEAYVGFPLRVGIAKAAGVLLGLESHATGTILALENELAAVDLPCSGLKSLWVGVLFILATSILQNLRVGWRWLAFCMFGLLTLLVLNLARVMVLTELIVTYGRRAWIDMIHVPLGMVAFCVACGTFIWFAKRFVPSEQTAPDSSFPAAVAPSKRKWGACVFSAVCLAACLVFHSPLPPQQAAPTALALPAMASLTDREITLTPAEQDLFSRFDTAIVAKYRFADLALSGSLLVSRSSHWRTHHNPEQCLRGMGIDFVRSETLLIKERPVRAVIDQKGQIIGMYWFQSQSRFTDDFSERIFASLWGKEHDWTLVSYLFDHPLPLQHVAIESRVLNTRNTIWKWMNVGKRSAI